MEWISVRNRLPEKGGEFLILEPPNFFLSLWYKGEWEPTCYCQGFDGHRFNPTHWMELPDTPNEET